MDPVWAERLHPGVQPHQSLLIRHREVIQLVEPVQQKAQYLMTMTAQTQLVLAIPEQMMVVHSLLV